MLRSCVRAHARVGRWVSRGRCQRKCPCAHARVCFACMHACWYWVDSMRGGLRKAHSVCGKWPLRVRTWLAAGVWAKQRRERTGRAANLFGVRSMLLAVKPADWGAAASRLLLDHLGRCLTVCVWTSPRHGMHACNDAPTPGIASHLRHFGREVRQEAERDSLHALLRWQAISLAACPLLLHPGGAAKSSCFAP